MDQPLPNPGQNPKEKLSDPHVINNTPPPVTAITQTLEDGTQVTTIGSVYHDDQGPAIVYTDGVQESWDYGVLTQFYYPAGDQTEALKVVLNHHQRDLTDALNSIEDKNMHTPRKELLSRLRAQRDSISQLVTSLGASPEFYKPGELDKQFKQAVIHLNRGSATDLVSGQVLLQADRRRANYQTGRKVRRGLLIATAVLFMLGASMIFKAHFWADHVSAYSSVGWFLWGVLLVVIGTPLMLAFSFLGSMAIAGGAPKTEDEKYQEKLRRQMMAANQARQAARATQPSPPSHTPAPRNVGPKTCKTCWGKKDDDLPAMQGRG